MLVYIQSFIAIILGVISAITDLKSKKIYNKNIVVFVIISFFIYLILCKEIDMIYMKSYLINLSISIAISFLFFYFKIWAAGDAKLFLAIIFMIPFELYEIENSNVFPGIYLLIIIFSIAFIYVFLETVYLWIIDKNRKKTVISKNIKKNEIESFIIKYFLGYFIVLFVNNILFEFFYNFKIGNAGLILICNMLLLTFIYRIITNDFISFIIMCVFMIFNIIYYVVYGLNLYAIDIKIIILVLIIMLFRNVSEKYNYEEIEVENLKPRMILSFGSVLKFYGSKVKGLPQSTSETTDSRLTDEEVKSIKRWSKTKKGEKTIVIVRHMPFAPFMFIGEVVFFILKLYR